MDNPITIYSTTTCGHCGRLKRQLDEAGVAYEEVDLGEHPHLGARIVEATGGYRVVPSVDVGGDLLVNPTLAEVRAALATSD
jgi:Glutaredoxin and related proteins